MNSDAGRATIDAARRMGIAIHEVGPCESRRSGAAWSCAGMGRGVDVIQKRKLIEVALPLEAINSESAHEKSVPRKGAPGDAAPVVGASAARLGSE